MKNLWKPLNDNQEGFILVLAMAMLVVLTLIGLSATRNSVTDIRIAGNERRISQDFYVGDSVWQIGSLWLNKAGKPTEIVNRTRIVGDTDDAYETKDYYKIVRNYGNGGNGVQNLDFAAGTRDGTYLSSNFWYKCLVFDSKKAENSGEGYDDYPFDIETSTSGSTKISARVFKKIKTAY